jgi:hypothetical protein
MSFGVGEPRGSSDIPDGLPVTEPNTHVYFKDYILPASDDDVRSEPLMCTRQTDRQTDRQAFVQAHSSAHLGQTHRVGMKVHAA